MSYLGRKCLSYFLTENLNNLQAFNLFFHVTRVFFAIFSLNSFIISTNSGTIANHTKYFHNGLVNFIIICVTFAENLSYFLEVLELFSKPWVILLSKSLSYFQSGEKKAWNSCIVVYKVQVRPSAFEGEFFNSMVQNRLKRNIF